MSNEGRIRNWQARRQSGGYRLGAGALERKGAPVPVTTLRRILDALIIASHETPFERRSVYEMLQTESDSEALHASLDEEVVELRRRQLRTAIRLVEEDIRAGVDVFTQGYAPATLASAQARLIESHSKRARRRLDQQTREARRRATRDDVAFRIDLAPTEAADLDVLRASANVLHARQRASQVGVGRSNPQALLPLLILQLQMIQGESRFALIWTLAGPAVLLTLISSLYFLMGTHFVLGMDVPTFSLLGATTWIMFRQIIFRSSASYVSARGLLNLRGVTPLMCALVQAIIYLAIYLMVFVILIAAGHCFDIVTLPSNWPAFLCFVASMGAAGMAMGLIFGSIATEWRFFLKLGTALERLLEIFSSVFFVSEQLPEQYRPYVLWSPFAHGMQLLRSVYFDSYHSSDASLTYYVMSLVILVSVALGVERFARSNVQPM
ncbi:capsular polysaccharide export ABC transporter transmembrane protein [Caballeronia pedi]|uniref:Capsular polysaccharide export ABC transporter transmembrane protein n=1 Tax=Caballeronia pedi TaxID=1777141 RepID=A0A158E2M1_9BURK|nr:sugar ABC transporter permease [Caballeronia pedi]SAL01119.1 capsular polysaccharide export ABC transporter transmembrane protein [Caballeronia pedi]